MAATRPEIQSRLLAFSDGQPLPSVAGEFFATLGYGSNRCLSYDSANGFFDQYDPTGKVAGYLRRADGPVLFQQLTSEEIAANSGDQLLLAAADGQTPDLRQIDSYLFLALDLPPGAVRTRGETAQLARSINALFPQPVLSLFRQEGTVSLAITYRRPNKRENSRDVIDRKVTLIRDISCRAPHPGHVSILEDFSLPALARVRQRDIRSFNDLDDAWRDSLSTQLLNRQFYREIANWYFWAREHAVFPKDAPLDAEGKPSLPLIRLLTRLIFCWFLREKSLPDGSTLIPGELFETARIHELLRDASPDATTYYTGILQNLFFATLNAEMDTPGQPPKRHFIGEGGDDQRDEHLASNVWRNPHLLADRAQVEAYFRRVPFLNGGLFECLDEGIFENKKKVGERRVDGFSTQSFKQAKLPNYLFFGSDHTEDLSGAYGDHSRRQEKVSPLLEIFRRYKFTLTENTPIEEEVALDPELLGHVFENLLAAYNPETGTVARKATGSFYTPRIVVDWMVDEALLAYLTERVPAAPEEAVRDLLSWESDTHGLPPATVSALIDAVDSLKSLDPACGSGAFPMGLLQKLVHLLGKLDPDNRQWAARQRAAIDQVSSAPARDLALAALAKAFARDQDDYGRKLYLIENCLYGVDIQPIAVQIAKLRFFIALVVDQSVTLDPAEENYGILPLPNLETKIVAANTLLGVRMGQLDFDFAGTRALSEELQRVRHEYFTARRYADKRELKDRDATLRQQLADALTSEEVCSAADAKRLADWNPYDTNRAASFFDPAWMFGLAIGRKRPSAATFRGNMTGIINQTAGQMELAAAPPADFGFDLVLGNPPYVRQEELKNVTVQDSAGRPRPLKEVLKENYECFTGTADLYVYFIERSFQLLRIGGVLSFITSNKYFRAAYGEKLRTYLLYATRPRVLLDFGDTPVFTAIAYPCILIAQKTREVEKGKLPPAEKFASEATLKQLISEEAASTSIRVFPWTPGPPLREFPTIFEGESFPLKQKELRATGWQLESPLKLRLMDFLRATGKPLKEFTGSRVFRGLTSGLNEAFFINGDSAQRLKKTHHSSDKLLARSMRGRDIERWHCALPDLYLIRIESSEIFRHPWSGKTDAEAEKIFRNEYPAIYARFNDPVRRKALIDRYDQGEYFWELRACAYWQAFKNPKIVSTKISSRPTFAVDTSGSYLSNTAYFIPTEQFSSYVVGLLNSDVFFAYAKRTFVEKQGGFYEVQPTGLEHFPIPDASADKKLWCERLSEAIAYLHRPEIAKSTPPVSLMSAWFEQWLNGLVYELFFRDELHAHHLRLFEETARPDNAPPVLASLPDDAARLSALRACFERTYDVNHPLRAMLFSLRSLESVRIIEGENDPVPAA